MAAAAAVGGDGLVVEEGKRQNVSLRGRGAMNTTKHLWSGAVAAMVSRFVILFYYLIFMVELVCLIVWCATILCVLFRTILTLI